jgi:DGQHR domain-containing protein
MTDTQMTLPAVEDSTDPNAKGKWVSYAARLITQGRHRFYTLTMPSDVLAETCVVDTREENPEDGFQRVLDRKRAQEIADYIDEGFGTIPCSIVLSAQPAASLEYISRTQVIRFKRDPRAFLILDGQHRVYGFKLAKAQLRVPVVIYNKLTKADEARCNCSPWEVAGLGSGLGLGTKCN